MSITASDEIELVTQTLDDTPIPDYLERQACVVEELGIQVGSTRRQLESTRRHLEELKETMSREEDLLLMLCRRAQREKRQQQRHGDPAREAAAERVVRATMSSVLRS